MPSPAAPEPLPLVLELKEYAAQSPSMDQVRAVFDKIEQHLEKQGVRTARCLMPFPRLMNDQKREILPVITIERAADHAGAEVTLRGWLYNLRESGKLLFPDFSRWHRRNAGRRFTQRTPRGFRRTQRVDAGIERRRARQDSARGARAGRI